MKKLLLILATGSIAVSASAQALYMGNRNAGQQEARSIEALSSRHHQGLSGIGHKTTAGPTTRWYNYGDLFDTTVGSASTGLNAHIMWWDTLGQINYTSGLAHNRQVSCGTTFHPQFTGFNDVVLYNGMMSMDMTKAFNIDSIALFGLYQFNTAKTSVVDTLILTLTYGNGTSASDIGMSYFTDATVCSRYGITRPSDSLVFPTIDYDSVTNTATGATKKTWKILLGSTLASGAWGDTSANGIWSKDVAVPGGFSVPAGNIVGFTQTFRSGDASFVAHDSIFTGNGRIRYNMYRPLVIYKAAGTTPEWAPYSHADLNHGQFKTLPNFLNGWGGVYVPMWAWSSGGGTAASSLQHQYVGFRVTCATCNTIGTNDVASSINEVIAYPNPANTELNVAYNFTRNADATITVSNILGAVVASKTVSNTINGTTTFSTSNIPNGMYIYTVSAGGKQVSGKINVAH